MLNSRKLEDLHPTVEKMAREFIKKCKEAGIEVLITSTLRDFASQDALYAQGRTKPGAKVTNAKAGQSFHNYGVALDFVVMKGGVCQWNDTKGFKKCGEIAESLSFEWAGRWSSFPEQAHIQYTAGLKLKDFQAGKHLP